MPKIFCFINSGSPGWYSVCALAEDGNGLASHISSSPSWAKHDIGYTGEWKHDLYAAHYPQGYELVWVDDVETHDELKAAYLLNQQLHETGNEVLVNDVT